LNHHKGAQYPENFTRSRSARAHFTTRIPRRYDVTHVLTVFPPTVSVLFPIPFSVKTSCPARRYYKIYIHILKRTRARRVRSTRTRLSCRSYVGFRMLNADDASNETSMRTVRGERARSEQEFIFPVPKNVRFITACVPSARTRVVTRRENIPRAVFQCKPDVIFFARLLLDVSPNNHRLTFSRIYIYTRTLGKVSDEREG
jgi:hypothetical protein